MDNSKTQKKIPSIKGRGKLPLIKKRGRFILPPRWGKTLMMLESINQLLKKDSVVLYVTEGPSLFNQIKAESDKIKWNYKIEFDFVSYRSLHKKDGFYDFIILDEEQNITEKNTVNLVQKKLVSEYLYTLTGTKTKDSKKINIFDQLGLTVLYEKSIKEGIKRNILSNYVFHAVEIPRIRKKTNKLNYFESIYTNSFISDLYISDNFFLFNAHRIEIVKGNNPDFDLLQIDRRTVGYITLDRVSGKLTVGGESYVIKNNSIRTALFKDFNIIYHQALGDNDCRRDFTIDFVKTLEGRTLIFCPNTDFASYFPYWYHSKDIVTSNVNYDLFKNNEINQLALVNKGGTGHNYHNIANVVITHSNKDRNGSVTQKLARGLLPDKSGFVNFYLLYLSESLEDKDKTNVENIVKSFKNKR